MLERYVQLTCDVCGITEVAADSSTTGAQLCKVEHWRRQGRKHMCQVCIKLGRTWADATLFA